MIIILQILIIYDLKLVPITGEIIQNNFITFKNRGIDLTISDPDLISSSNKMSDLFCLLSCNSDQNCLTAIYHYSKEMATNCFTYNTYFRTSDLILSKASTVYAKKLSIATISRLRENVTCSSSNQCFEPMTCTSFNICQCGAFEYHNFETLTCSPQQSINRDCSVDFNCRVDKYLECIKKTCQCNSTTQFWSGTACVNYHTYNTANCKSDSECNYNETGLICRTSGESCDCPDTVGIGYCDCEHRALDNEYYWNGSQCVDAGLYGDACTNNYQCQELTNLVTCDSSTNKCKCSEGIYDDERGICIVQRSTPDTVICVSGWTAYGNSCYKSVDLNVPGGFGGLNDTKIRDLCVNPAGVTGVIPNRSDYVLADYDWLHPIICTNTNIIAYFGPVNIQICNVFDCRKNSASLAFTTHTCNHGYMPDDHAIICKYT